MKNIKKYAFFRHMLHNKTYLRHEAKSIFFKNRTFAAEFFT